MTLPEVPTDLETMDCVLCGASAASKVIEDCPDRLLGTPGLYSVVRCDDCGLLRTNPRPTPAAIDQHYPATYVPFNLDAERKQGLAGALRELLGRRFEQRYGRTDLVVAPPDGSGRRLLDVGAGSGTYAYRMSAAGWDVWALEPSDMAARAAVDVLGRERVCSARIEGAEYPESFFDLVTVNHVLEHLHEPVTGLRRLRRWIRPGGHIRVTVPNVDSPDRKLLGSSWLGFDLPRHLYHFAPDTIGRLLEHCGYVVESNIPQWLPSMFAQSVAVAVNRVRKRPSPGRLPYYAAYPVGALIANAGITGAMTVTASRPG